MTLGPVVAVSITLPPLNSWAVAAFRPASMSLNPQWPTNDPAHSLPGTAMKFGELGSPMVLADTGAEGLMVIDRALEAALRLPAVSAAVAVTECVPGAKTLDVIDQALAALALPEPRQRVHRGPAEAAVAAVDAHRVEAERSVRDAIKPPSQGPI